MLSPTITEEEGEEVREMITGSIYRDIVYILFKINDHMEK